ncbi:hypothetical protein WAI453_009349 [Rhynchosporium graminicola]
MSAQTPITTKSVERARSDYQDIAFSTRGILYCGVFSSRTNKQAEKPSSFIPLLEPRKIPNQHRGAP